MTENRGTYINSAFSDVENGVRRLLNEKAIDYRERSFETRDREHCVIFYVGSEADDDHEEIIVIERRNKKVHLTVVKQEGARKIERAIVRELKVFLLPLPKEEKKKRGLDLFLRGNNKIWPERLLRLFTRRQDAPLEDDSTEDRDVMQDELQREQKRART